MHIPDGILDPGTQLAAGAVSAAAVGYSLYKLRTALEDRLVPMIGVMAAGIFAGQMVNFPLFVLPTSGHLMGGVLAGVVLGPWGAVLALANVLLVQCLLYADGGLASLGANLFNMGVIGGALGYAIYDPLRRWIGGNRGVVIGAVLASWLIIPISALAFAVELTAGGQYPFVKVGTAMLFYHVLIGLGEALITGMTVAWIVRVRPDLIYQPHQPQSAPARIGQSVLGGMAAALAVAIFLAPLASQYVDGLEQVAAEVGFGTLAVDSPAPFPDYELPAAAEASGEEATAASPWWRSAMIVTSALGVLGTLATFVVGLGLAQSARIGAQPNGPGPAHAA